jgi:hypothetical protein
MKLFLTLVFSQLLLITTAQTKKAIDVTPGQAEVQQVNRQGMQVIIELDEKFVTKNWIQKLKEYGKVESEKGGYVIHGANIPSVSASCTVYSAVTATSKGVVVFWAIDLGAHYITEGHTHYHYAKTKLRDFAASAYIADVNVQISAAENALASSVKNQEKLIKERESLKNDSEKNVKEKAKLNENIANNEVELKSLAASEAQIENRMKEVKATDNHEEQQKLLKESLSITNNIEKNKQQTASYKDKLAENEKERLKLIEDTKTNAANITAANEEVAKMTKALEVVKDKLKMYQ